MRAWRVHELGEPLDVMRLDDGVEPPRPGLGEVRVAPSTVGLNFFDDLVCRGLYQHKPALPFSPGVELSGRVLELGAGVAGFEVGQRVVGMSSMTAGALAEESVTDARMTFAIPDGMPDHQGAALVVTYGTAHAALHRRARLSAGETVLVHAGAGGVGSAAIQLAAAAGARVLATAGGPEKVEVCRKLGADVAIDYTAGDFVAPVREATDGRGVDVVVDPVGGDVFDRSVRCLAWEGRLVVVGFTSGRIPTLPANLALLKNISVMGLAWGAYLGHDPALFPEIHADLIGLWEKGLVDPLVRDVLPFEQAAQGIADLASRRTVGKVVVRVN
jgi:NADPH2:quinone reductase